MFIFNFVVMTMKTEDAIPAIRGCTVCQLTEKCRTKLLFRLKVCSYMLVVASYITFYLVYTEFGEYQRINNLFKVSL